MISLNRDELLFVQLKIDKFQNRVIFRYWIEIRNVFHCAVDEAVLTAGSVEGEASCSITWYSSNSAIPNCEQKGWMGMESIKKISFRAANVKDNIPNN